MLDSSPFFPNTYIIYKSFSDLFISNLEIKQILNGLPNYNKHLIEWKKEYTDGTLNLAIPNSEKPFHILCDSSKYGIGTALLQKKTIWENGTSFGKLSPIFVHRT